MQSVYDDVLSSLIYARVLKRMHIVAPPRTWRVSLGEKTTAPWLGPAGQDALGHQGCRVVILRIVPIRVSKPIRMLFSVQPAVVSDNY